MKKIISVLIIAVMLFSAAAVNVSATIYMFDQFDEMNTDNWVDEVSRFYVQDGWLMSDGAPVHQSEYGDDVAYKKVWSECDITVDIRFDDYYADSEDYMAGLWWKDYQLAPGEEWYEGMDIDNGVIYELLVCTETRRIILQGDFGQVTATTESNTDTAAETTEPVETKYPIIEYFLPDDYKLDVNFSDPTILNLGMKVEPDGISAFLDGEFLFKYKAPTQLGMTKASPICLINHELIVGYDNFTVASLDHGLLTIPEGADTAVVGTGAVTSPDQNNGAENNTPDTKKEIVTETQIVTDTDEAGNIVEKVEVVTKEVVVTVPSADTNTGGTAGGNATTTGDMAVIVIAAMIVSFGAAIVVKKVSVK